MPYLPTLVGGEVLVGMSLKIQKWSHKPTHIHTDFPKKPDTISYLVIRWVGVG